jgi:hypothetical protein
MDDRPHLRAQPVCPLCGATKEADLVVCWECYSLHELRWGNPAIEQRLDKLEEEEVGRPAPDEARVLFVLTEAMHQLQDEGMERTDVLPAFVDFATAWR